MNMACIIPSVLAVAASAWAVWFARRWKPRAQDAENSVLLLNTALASERHQVSMYRKMVRRLGCDLPADSVYDKEGEG